MNRRSFLKTTLAATAATTPFARSEMARLEAFAEANFATVPTTAGPIRGAVHNSIASFRGIPYGADTRARRFQPPLPPTPWKTVRDALVWADRAPQLGGSSGMTTRPQTEQEIFRLPPDESASSEDCLHLNVFTPSPQRGGHESRPVLFYIHGGAYNSGTANSVLYDGTRLCKRGDVVVVTVNHRLNAFGYLYLAEATDDPTYADSGNVGQLDLILALKWVRDNIANFGGDPSRVTIFGQSGGGAKSATLMAMPPAHGLFRRVMTMSGQQVTAAPRSIAAARTRDFLTRLGLQDTPAANLRETLDALPLTALEDAARVSSAWLPVVDGRSLPRDPFDPDAPPLSSTIPMILGNTHDETRGLIGSAQPALFALTWGQLPAALTKNIGAFLGPVTPEIVVSSYRAWYPAYSPADVFFAAATAFRSWPGQVLEAERRADSPATARTWVYQMNFPSPVAGGRFGAPHTMDIPFFFDNLAVSPGMIGAGPEHIAAAQPLATMMSAALITYARTGDPNHPGMPPWPTYDTDRRPTMLWDLTPSISNDPRSNERRLAATAHYRQPGT
jgi:para-nitrobenzyl esterase